MEQQTVAPQEEVSNSPSTGKSKRNWLRSPVAMLVTAFGLAIAMWAANFQPVSSDTTKLTVAYEPGVSDAELLNVKSPVWNENRENKLSKETDTSGNSTNRISTTVVPLSAQYIAPQQGGSIMGVRARAAFNDKTVAVLVQWQDESKNTISLPSQNQYSDSVALEFPLVLVPGHQPFRCMGQNDAQVNIWQWKAERDPVAGDSRIAAAKAAKNYLGPGVGYLKDTTGADPDSAAAYDEATKTWSVIFSRKLSQGDDKSATQFTPGQATLVAFAVWDGGAGERLSKKAVSTWVDFIFQPGESTTQTLINVGVLGGVGVLMLVAIAVAWRVLPSTRRA